MLINEGRDSKTASKIASTAANKMKLPNPMEKSLEESIDPVAVAKARAAEAAANFYNYNANNVAEKNPKETNAMGKKSGVDSEVSSRLSPEYKAIEAKLSDAQARLAKLTAEVEAGKEAKLTEEKAQQQKQIGDLKTELEKMKAEKTAVAAITPQTPIASNPSSVVQSLAPQKVNAPIDLGSEHFNNRAQAQAQFQRSTTVANISRANSAIDSRPVTKADGDISASALRVTVRENLVDLPNVDMLSSPNENPEILLLAKKSKLDSFPIQDKNKIIWNIIPLKDQVTGEIVSYTPVREKEKKVVAKNNKQSNTSKLNRAPASQEFVGPPKREFLLKDLNSILNKPSKE
jgi:hypothetical protein